MTTAMTTKQPAAALPTKTSAISLPTSKQNRSMTFISILSAKIFVDAKPHTLRMWFSSLFPCASCNNWSLKYVRSHGGTICTSDECEQKVRRLAHMLIEHNRTQLQNTNHETAAHSLDFHSDTRLRLCTSHQASRENTAKPKDMHLPPRQLSRRLYNSRKADMKTLSHIFTKHAIPRFFIYTFLVLSATVASFNIFFIFIPKSLLLIPLFFAAALLIGWWDRR
ncbi:MAG TPA: hypothetical protein VI636_14140 [Candidatus Angelobacter sp.]